MTVAIAHGPFDAGACFSEVLRQSRGCGALVSFLGLLRDFNAGYAVEAMFLEHYPGMLEKSLAAIEAEARRRWNLTAVSILHRVGEIAPSEPIVFVGVACAHRLEAFLACEFIMDVLKTRAPLWKRERGEGSARWVEARGQDQLAAGRW